MPAAVEYVPPNHKDRDSFTAAAAKERWQRRQIYLTALKYFNGDHPEQLEYDPDLEPNDNTMINMVKITAERTASFLFPQLPEFRTDPQSVDPTPEEIWIKKWLNSQGGLYTFNKLALRGFLAGHTYIRVKAGRMLRGGRREMPKLVLLDPLAVTTYWAADDVGEVLWYENRYMAGSEVVIEDYVWRPDKGDAGEWEILTYKRESKKVKQIPEWQIGGPHGSADGNTQRPSDVLDFISGAGFKLIKTPLGDDAAVHASNIPPIIEIRHLPHPDSYYGLGEANQNVLQDTINRLWSEINRIVREHSDPTDVIVGTTASDVQQGGNLLTVGDQNAKVQRLEMKGDLTAAVTTVDKLIETYLAVARVVLLKGEAKDLQRVTNASVRTLFIDMLAKNEVLRYSYGPKLEQVVKLAMLMSGEPFATRAADMEVNIVFAEPLPVDKSEIANINAIQVNMGARSKRRAAELIGDNWAAEKPAIDMEGEEALNKQVKQAGLMSKFTPPTDNKKPIS